MAGRHESPADCETNRVSVRLVARALDYLESTLDHPTGDG